MIEKINVIDALVIVWLGIALLGAMYLGMSELATSIASGLLASVGGDRLNPPGSRREKKTMKVFVNPGHAPNGQPDPGAVNSTTGLRESDVAINVGQLVVKYLNASGSCTAMQQQVWIWTLFCQKHFLLSQYFHSNNYKFLFSHHSLSSLA